MFQIYGLVFVRVYKCATYKCSTYKCVTSPKLGGFGFEFGLQQMFDLSEVGRGDKNSLWWDKWREK
jgi:hypothetical protein